MNQNSDELIQNCQIKNIFPNNPLSRPPTFPVVVNRATILMPGEAITVRLADCKAESGSSNTVRPPVLPRAGLVSSHQKGPADPLKGGAVLNEETVLATVEPRRGNVLQWPAQQIVKSKDRVSVVLENGGDKLNRNDDCDNKKVYQKVLTKVGPRRGMIPQVHQVVKRSNPCGWTNQFLNFKESDHRKRRTAIEKLIIDLGKEDENVQIILKQLAPAMTKPSQGTCAISKASRVLIGQ